MTKSLRICSWHCPLNHVERRGREQDMWMTHLTSATTSESPLSQFDMSNFLWINCIRIGRKIAPNAAPQRNIAPNIRHGQVLFVPPLWNYLRVVQYSTVLHSSTPGCPYKLKATKMMYLQHTISTTLNNLSEDKKILN